MKRNISFISLFFVVSCFTYSCTKNNGMLQSTGDLSKSTAETTIAAPQTAAAAAASCSAPGWASQNGGTRGGSGTVTVVTSFSQLDAAIKSSSVKLIEVRGTITIPSAGQIDFKDQSAKTLYGVSGARLLSNDQTKTGSGIMYMRRCSNVIIRNLVFEGPGAYDVDGEDNLTIDECTNIWVDHCEFRDGVDGNLDIKNASNYLTLTYTKFDYQKPPKAGGSGGSNDHRYSDLIGSSDSHTADRGKLNITFDRCWWAQGCVERMPRVRFGKLHIVNNYFNSTVSNYCVGAGIEANILVEGNVFERVDEPIRFIANNFTAVTQRNNTFTSTTGNTAGSGTAFTPPYSLTVVSPATAKSSITGSGGAGATLGGNVCTSL